MGQTSIPTPSSREAVEHFEDAARNLRERFRSAVLEALPGFACQLFDQEWQDVADLQSIEGMPPLALAYLTGCERCVYDLLNRNYEGVASAHFEKCVSEAAEAIRARAVASRSSESVVIRIMRQRTA